MSEDGKIPELRDSSDSKPVKIMLDGDTLEGLYDEITNELVQTNQQVFRARVRDRESGKYIKPPTGVLAALLKAFLNENIIAQADTVYIISFGRDIEDFLKVLHHVRMSSKAIYTESHKRVAQKTIIPKDGEEIEIYLHGFKSTLTLNLGDFIE